MAPTPSMALVTGAASGIGAAIAQRLASEGAHVICVDSNAQGLDTIVSSIRSAGGSAGAEVTDLGDAAAVTALIARLDVGALDQLALCAGIFVPTAVTHFDLADYHRVVDVNLTSALQLAVGLVPSMSTSASPRIVFISSIQATHGEAGSAAYAVSKAGLVAATKVLAVELAGRGILVNAIAPGFIDTPMIVLPDGTNELQTDMFASVYVDAGKLPLGRAGTASEVAVAATFLLSPSNSYITGHVLVVDGGLTATF